MGPSSRACSSRVLRRGPAVAGLPSRACRRGPAVAIVVRSVLGRTACRGHQPHHYHRGRHRRGHRGRL